jgi:type III secretion inner rod protein HrpB2
MDLTTMSVAGLSGVSGVSGSQAVPGAAGGNDANAALVERFNRLMETAPPQVSGGGVPTALTDFVKQQQTLYTQADNKAAAFGRDAPSLSMEQLAIRQVELIQAVSQAQTQFTATTAIAQSSKSGLQTLMKNQ